ncbi:hypothetical protein DFH07DRAFT_831101 [Mycena maculata]|uniref:Cytochrome c oxidase subunit 8, mitochondrial n=1 Tax=Mycena maculata TaxID=230809 RepID=A0AAD7N648_9AGAR|nr:hypothetical protein DFH07DRAFT_831101 [Mycena maculata]
MTSLARSAIPTLRAIRIPPSTLRWSRRRMTHTHAAEYNNVPFDYSNSRTFAIKCAAYMGFGFALPFVAVGWQWYKPGGYKNP